MSYDNRFSVKILKYPIETINKKECPTCSRAYEIGDTFCVDDGSKLIKVRRSTGKEIKNIIHLFRQFSDSAHHLIDDKGNTECGGSGGEMKSDLIKFSKKYPDAIFQLECRPDSGFESPDERTYISNGKSQESKLVMVWEEFDQSKLD